MNSALKPVLPQPGSQPGGQASPAKANVASLNHSVALPQGAQNSLQIAGGGLVGHNLTHHAPPPQLAPHAVPSMAPVSANMAQMAQNMSHHGNLSHVTQNSVAPTVMAASPSKSASTSSSSAPLALVQDKANGSQPLALTRTPEKKESESTGQPNGTIESPKSASSAPTTFKALNPEPNKDKQDIAKTSPSTTKPPEKPSSASSTPQKAEANNSNVQSESPVQPKVATANEPTEKLAKLPEAKPAPTADVAPSHGDNKPVPESAKDTQIQESAPTPEKEEAPTAESAKTEASVKVEEKKEEVKQDNPQPVDEKKEDKVEPPKKEETIDKIQKVDEKIEVKKSETKTLSKGELKVCPKPTMKLATVTPPMRKRRRVSPSQSTDGNSSAKKPVESEGTPDSRIKRNRTQVQLYQSPTPDIAMATKLSASAGRSTPTKQNDDKLIVFYKNEYLAVRNAEGGFYVCQAMQNVYRTTRKIKIRWLSQDKSADPSGETYKPDFYDVTDMECVLTTLSLQRGGGGTQILRASEQERATSILQRALRAEQGAAPAGLTEEHPDGLDLSLYTDESQLEKKSRKRNSSKSSPRSKDNASETANDEATPAKKSRTTPKRSPKNSRKAKPSPNKTPTNSKRKSAGSTPTVANTSKTATALSEKPKGRAPPSRRSESSPSTPTRLNRRSAKESKSPLVATPSTSSGKTARTPRKPPAKK